MMKELASDLMVEPSPLPEGHKNLKESKSVRTKQSHPIRQQDLLDESLGLYKQN